MASTKRPNELEAELAHMRRVLAIIADAVVLIDRSGCIELLDPNAERIFNRRNADVVDQHVTTLLSAPEGESLDRLFRRLLEGHTVGIACEAKRGDASSLPIYLALGPERDEGRELTLLVHDLSVSRRAKDVLRSRDAPFDSMYASVGGSVIASDARGRIVAVNPAFCRFIGYDEAELLGRSFLEITVEDDIEETRAQFAKIVEERRLIFDFEKRYRRKDGGVVWGRLSGAPVYDSAGNLQASIALVVDITARKSSERLLAMQRQYLSAIVGATQEGIFSIDAAGTIRSFYPSAERLLGYASSAVVGRDVREIAEWDGPVDETPRGAPHRVRMTRGDQTTVDVELSVTWVEELSLFVCTAYERERITSELRAARRMDAIGRLAVGIAHDFSNLLMGVGGCATLARDALAADSAARPYLDEISRTVESGNAIIQQLLAASAQRELAPCVFELDAVLRRSETVLARLLGADVEYRVQSGANGLQIEADPGQLDQLLMNLAINARDAMPKGGRLTVRSEPRPDGILLVVEDTGCGMDADTVAHAFEPYFTTKADHGSGLGLATVHGIVQQAGGRIDVESEVGRGTRFEIVLPTAQAPTDVDRRVARPPSAQDASAGTILLVEDEPAVRLALRGMLEQAGFVVLEACTGLEAIEAARSMERSIDLLVTDVVLPQKSGVDVARQVAELKGAPVLFVSAHTAQHLRAAKDFPADARLLQKPFTRRALLEQVTEALRAG